MVQFVDFNSAPSPTVLAAAASTHETLVALFDKLARADDALSLNPDTPRAPVLDALRAVIEFAAANPNNVNGRFTRPLELLWVEVSAAGHAPARSILPTVGGGSGGVNRRRVAHHVKASAAFAVEQLHQSGLTVAAAAGEVAGVLIDYGFPFGANRADSAAAVKAWRRDYPRAASPAAKHYRDLAAAPPLALSGTSEAYREAVLARLRDQLERAGYGRE
jgi:hypothetical protein